MRYVGNPPAFLGYAGRAPSSGVLDGKALGDKATLSAQSVTAASPTTYQTLSDAGAGICSFIDPGDSSSWAGSGTSVDNIESSPADSSTAGDWDFNLGDGSTAATYPLIPDTAIGDARGLVFIHRAKPSYLRIGGSNPTTINNAHKDNALWSIGLIVQTDGLATVVAVATATGQSAHGIQIYIQSGNIGLQVANGSGSSYALTVVTTGAPVTANTLHFIGVAVDEANTNGRFWVDGAEHSTFTSTYSSPSSNSASTALTVGAPTNLATDNVQMALGPWFMTNDYMTDAQWTAAYNDLKLRYGLS